MKIKKYFNDRFHAAYLPTVPYPSIHPSSSKVKVPFGRRAVPGEMGFIVDLT